MLLHQVFDLNLFYTNYFLPIGFSSIKMENGLDLEMKSNMADVLELLEQEMKRELNQIHEDSKQRMTYLFESTKNYY